MHGACICTIHGMHAQRARPLRHRSTSMNDESSFVPSHETFRIPNTFFKVEIPRKFWSDERHFGFGPVGLPVRTFRRPKVRAFGQCLNNLEIVNTEKIGSMFKWESPSLYHFGSVWFGTAMFDDFGSVRLQHYKINFNWHWQELEQVYVSLFLRDVMCSCG